MNLLLDDRFAPITSEIGFLEAGCSLAAATFADWQRPIQATRGVSLEVRSVSGALVDVLQSLLPLTSVERRRYLFVPTRSAWTAFFDNGHRGADAVSTVSQLATMLGCRGLRIVATPNTISSERRGARGRHGATIFELYGPSGGHFLNYVRSISAVNDGGKWVFSQAGDVQSFEQPARYEARSVKNRFTWEMLRDACRALALAPFEEDFYASGDGATLVEKRGPAAAGMREYTLAEARASF